MVTYPNAKINLGLNITEKRSDGYHNIESLFFPIPLSDKLEIKTSDRFKFTSTGIAIDGSPQNNLVVKAYELMKKPYDLPPVAIHLHKVIPFGGGLGGGSSDASFCITTLNTLFELNLDTNTMISHAEKIGADCPFFINNKPSLATGIGNILRTVDINLKGYILILIKPNFGVPTPLAYSKVVPQKPQISIAEIIKMPISGWRNTLKNDFEKSVFKAYGDIKNIKSKLYSGGAIYASMSGSGSTVFGLFVEKINLEDQFPGLFYYSCKL